MSHTDESPFRVRLLAIALVSFAILVFEVASTRLLSVVLWYHWAFLAISLAMLGLGAPGVWLALKPPRRHLAGWLLVVAGPLVPLSVIAIFQLGRYAGPLKPIFCMLCLLAPMLALGAAVCVFLLSAPGPRVATMYGSDLIGASLGALVVIPLMWWVPTPQLVAALGFLPLIAAWLLKGPPRRWAPVSAALVAALLVWGEPLHLRYTKSYDERVLVPIIERWTPTARLAFFDYIMWRAGERDVAFGWGMGSRAPEAHVEQYWMDQDGSAGTPITRFDGDLSEVAYLNFDVTTVGYQWRRPERVAVIGAGGGRDILSALLNGARDVDAVELNAAIVSVVSNEFEEVSGDIYHRDGVSAVVSEGRAFLTGSKGGYDLIQISLIDSWAATAAGAFALSENNLYTVEAYELYWQRLSDSGVVSTSRWRRGHGGLELPRLIGLHQEALTRLGVARPGDHLAVIAAGRIGTVLLSRRPLTHDDRRQLAAICDERGFELHHPPAGDLAPTPPDPQIARALAEGAEAAAPAGFDLRPPFDDRPFFFQVLPPFGRVDLETARRYGGNSEAVVALQWLMLVLGALTVVLFFAPFALTRALPRRPDFWRGSAYFAAIGGAFLLLEIPWLQRFILFLGHPSRATTVVLGGMLLGGGAGALLAARIGLQRWRRAAWLTVAAAAVVNLSLPALFDAALALPVAARTVLALLVVTPMGFLMGPFLPLGMIRFGDLSKAWFWALNGATSVLASVLSLALAMQLGLAAVGWLGVALYAVAALLLGGRPASDSLRRALAHGTDVARETPDFVGRISHIDSNPPGSPG